MTRINMSVCVRCESAAGVQRKWSIRANRDLWFLNTQNTMSGVPHTSQRSGKSDVLRSGSHCPPLQCSLRFPRSPSVSGPLRQLQPCLDGLYRGRVGSGSMCTSGGWVGGGVWSSLGASILTRPVGSFVPPPLVAVCDEKIAVYRG